jgi:hypothetical protein
MTDTGNSTMTPYDFIYFVANDLSPHTPVIEVSFDVDIRYSFGSAHSYSAGIEQVTQACVGVRSRWRARATDRKIHWMDTFSTEL